MAISADTQMVQRYELIDTHCHLDFSEFDHDRAEVISSAANNGVQTIVVPAVSAATWPNTIDLCHTRASCFLALGLHPIFIDQHQPDHLNELEDLVDSKPSKLIAIGEIGLDFYNKKTLNTSSDRSQQEKNREKQIAYFSKQLIIANRARLPVIIHNRKAHDECIGLLQELQPKGGIVHAFNGSIQQAQKYIELGFALGFGGMLTFDRSAKLHTLAKAIPLHHIVLETDAPDMTVSQHRGERNSPAYLPYVLRALARIKGIAEQEVAEITTATAKTIFSI